jgi:hypothetical protein
MSTIVLAIIVLLGLTALLSARGRKSSTDASRPRSGLPTPVTSRPDQRAPYERIPALLTAAEHDFFAILQQATPTGHQIFAQVRLANLVQIQPWARRDFATRAASVRVSYAQAPGSARAVERSSPPDQCRFSKSSRCPVDRSS